MNIHKPSTQVWNKKCQHFKSLLFFLPDQRGLVTVAAVQRFSGCLRANTEVTFSQCAVKTAREDSSGAPN